MSAILRIIVAILAVAFGSTVLAEEPVYRIGSWNIEKLLPDAGRGFPESSGEFGGRTNSQLREIGEYLRDDVFVDAMMLSEIGETSVSGNIPQSSQLEAIADEMGSDWEYFLGETGGNLRLAFLYNTNAVTVKKIAEFNVSEFTIQGEDIFDRDPLIVWISLLDASGNEANDLIVIGLHLKSVQKYRDNHLVAMVKLVTELKEFKSANGIDASEKDVLICGDLNDSAHRRSKFKYLFEYLSDKRYYHLGPTDNTHVATRINGSEIDHLFISRDLYEDEIDPFSFFVHEPTGNLHDYRSTFSDHYPLTVDIMVTEDDD